MTDVIEDLSDYTPEYIDINEDNQFIFENNIYYDDGKTTTGRFTDSIDRVQIASNRHKITSIVIDELEYNEDKYTGITINIFDGNDNFLLYKYDNATKTDINNNIFNSEYFVYTEQLYDTLTNDVIIDIRTNDELDNFKDTVSSEKKIKYKITVTVEPKENVFKDDVTIYKNITNMVQITGDGTYEIVDLPSAISSLYIDTENGHLYVNNELKYGDESDSFKVGIQYLELNKITYTFLTYGDKDEFETDDYSYFWLNDGSSTFTVTNSYYRAWAQSSYYIGDYFAFVLEADPDPEPEPEPQPEPQPEPEPEEEVQLPQDNTEYIFTKGCGVYGPYDLCKFNISSCKREPINLSNYSNTNKGSNMSKKMRMAQQVRNRGKRMNFDSKTNQNMHYYRILLTNNEYSIRELFKKIGPTRIKTYRDQLFKSRINKLYLAEINETIEYVFNSTDSETYKILENKCL